MTWEGLTPPYRTIVADPPWEYADTFTTQSSALKASGRYRRYRLPYSHMTLDDIKAMPVLDLAESDARLFLWMTNRYLPHAFAVASAWGFHYRQTLVWHKRDGNIGGSVAPNSAEFLLVCVRGAPPVIEKAASAVVVASQSKTHSKKPEVFLDLIEQVSPGPYVELFARRQRLGWDSWGYGYEQAAS